MSAGDERPAATRAQEPSAVIVDALSPGTIVKNTYRILNFVGEGGAGAVYVAEHVSLGHQVAVKTLFGKYVRDEDMRRRFIEEAIIQANLSHPNIVKVVDVLDEPPLSAIFMEYVDGSSLDKRLSRLSEPEPVERTAAMFLSVLEAMSYAHAQGVVHRDIKPANIMMTGSGEGAVPKVTDFGIAKVLSDHARTETGTAMGTVYYAPPEQLTDAKSVDHRADIYSLGCTLYEMLTLTLPFEDPTMFGVMRKHVQAPRPDPSRVNANVSRELSGIVMRAMAVRPDHRFQTCGEFAAEIRKALGFATMPSLAAMGGTGGSGPLRIGAGASTGAGSGGFARGGHGAQGGVTGPGATGPALGGPGATGPAATGPAATGPAATGPTATGPGSIGLGATGPRSTPKRGSARGIRPGTIHAPKRAPRNSNVVATLIWVAIGVAAVALVAMVLLGGRRDPAPVADAPDVGPDVAAAPVAAVVAADAEGSAETEVDADVEPEVEAPAGVDPQRVTYCTALASRYLNFDPLGDVSYSDAITELEDNQESCAQLLDGNARGAFETATAFLTGVQTRVVQHDLLARRTKAMGGEPCEDALVAATEAHRGLRRISVAALSGDLLQYEVTSLHGFRTTLTDVYVGLRRDFWECPFVPIPEELLEPGTVVPSGPPDKPTPIAEGSGTPPPPF